MIKEKQEVLLKHLRENSRKSLVKISKETNIPVSTLFDTLRKLESSIVLKHVSLIDFLKLGYGTKVHFVISSKKKQELKEFLMQSYNVNTLSSLINGHDFYVECIFKDLKQMTEFKEKLEKFEINNLEENFVVDEVKKEGFGL